MRTNKSAIVFAAVFSLIVGGILIFMPSEIRGAPGTIYVDDNAFSWWYDATHVHTIQEGVDNATTGDTIFVAAGDIQTCNVEPQQYLGEIDSTYPQLVSIDVLNSDMEIYNDTIYIAFSRYAGGTPTIHACKFWPSNHTLSAVRDVATYDTTNHFFVSMDIDVDGYIHIVWGQHTSQETYVCSNYPESILSWTPEEYFCDYDATYQNVRCYGTTVYNLYRDGSHGQGWKLIWKDRGDSLWTQRKIVDGSGYDPDHPYMYREGQMYFEDSDHIYLAPFWTYDNAAGGSGTRQYQRVTRYNLTAGKHYHLDGTVIGYGNGSMLPHDGPKYYYGQCGDIILDSLQPKYTGAARQQLGKLALGIARTGTNIVVLGNVGENSTLGYPPRSIMASVWDGSMWTQSVLTFPFIEDLGSFHVQHCQGPVGETLWLVERKPTNGYVDNSTTDITILRNTDNGYAWTYENFTNDDAKWQHEPEAVYSPTYGKYIITWLQNNGSKTNGNTLNIGYSQVLESSPLVYVDDNAFSWWYDATHVRTIQEGVDNATAGDTVFVFNGTYYENVIVNKTIDLIGEDRNGTVIRDGEVVIFLSDHVSIANFTIDGIYGIRIINSDFCEVKNINVLGKGTEHFDSGIVLDNSNYNTVSYNTLIDNSEGIYLQNNSSNNIISNNIGYANNHSLILLENNCNFNTINNNTVYVMRYGIKLEFCHNNTITDNNCSSLISRNHSGIYLNYSSNNIIYNNYFDNAKNAYDNGNNVWNIRKTFGTNIIGGPYLGGNYWSDFDEPSEGAYDNNCDGIVDSPYNIPGGSNQDNYPVTEQCNLSDKNITACRDIFPDSLGPGQSFTVSVTLLAHDDITGPALDEDVPSGWTVTPVDNVRFIYKPSTTEWVFIGAWTAGDNATIIYEVTIPPSTPYDQYEITGVVTAYKADPFPVGCDFTIDVVEDWNPWDNDAIITTVELQEIVNHWANDISKNGHFVTTPDLQAMLFMWLNS